MEKDKQTGKKVRTGRFVRVKPSDEDQFVNLRAEMCWRMRYWILRGGRLIVSAPQDEEDWLQLAKLKYSTILEGRRGKLQIISKEELLRHGIESPDIADGLILTFYRGPTRSGNLRRNRRARGRRRLRPVLCVTWLAAIAQFPRLVSRCTIKTRGTCESI